MHLGQIFHRNYFKMHLGVLLNKTISEWQGQNFPCYNKMNRSWARTVADQNVESHLIKENNVNNLLIKFINLVRSLMVEVAI